MKTRLLLVSSTTLAWLSGCDGLSVDPGADYDVKVTQPDVQIVQQVGNYDLEFEVTGCTNFDAAVSVNGGERHPLQPQAIGNGRFHAAIPIEQLRTPDAYCVYDTEHPQKTNGTLSITCRKDARVTAGYFQVSYAPAWRTTYRGRGPVDAVFAGPSPDRFYEVGSGWLSGVVATSENGPEAAATTANGWAPLLAESADQSVRLWSACPINDCGSFYFVDTPTEKKMSGAAIVQLFQLQGDQLSFVKNITAPPDGVDLVPDGNGALLLSQTSGAATVTRITDAATVIADLEGELDPTKFALLDGARVFLTHTDAGRIRLHRSDGTLVADVPAPGAGPIEFTSLAPTGDAWVTVRGAQAWISTFDRGSATATATQLPSTLAKLTDPKTDGRDLGAAWTSTGVVLRDETGVELYERTGSFAKRWSAPSTQASVTAALGVGDSLAVLSTSGLQIFDPAGRVTGGVDPLDRACAFDFTAQHLAVIGPDTVALGGRGSTYQLKVGAVSLEVSR